MGLELGMAMGMVRGQVLELEWYKYQLVIEHHYSKRK